MTDSPSLSVGSRAVLQNLQGRPELNNQLVIVEERLKDENEGRYRVRPLGSKAKDLAPSPHMAIKAVNLRPAPDSAFLATVTYEDQDLLLPLTILADRDGLGQVGLHLMYSSFMGIKAVAPALKAFLGDFQCEDWTNEEEVEALLENAGEYGIVTTPIHDEQARANLKENEVMIVKKKHAQMYQAMIDYEIVKPLSKTASAGGWGDVPLCKILVPFDADWRGPQQQRQDDLLQYLQSQGAEVLNLNP
jgi:hypothetical protein